MKSALLAFLSLIVLLVSCRKDSFTSSPDARVAISADTLKFDTVFTTVGSTTKQLKVYNPNNKRIVLSSIRLARGTSSNFRLNIDGVPTRDATDVEIAALNHPV